MRVNNRQLDPGMELTARGHRGRLRYVKDYDERTLQCWGGRGFVFVRVENVRTVHRDRRLRGT